MLNFGEALQVAKEGSKIARKGWNGKNMWVAMTPGKVLNLAEHDIWTQNVKDVAEANGGKVTLQPYMIMKNVVDEIQIGWIATQSDMLADDWFIVDK